jgi:hypothetical protein
MKVVAYLTIDKAPYVGVHNVGVLCDNGISYAISITYPLPKLGYDIENIKCKWILYLDPTFKFRPRTKLCEYLAAGE